MQFSELTQINHAVFHKMRHRYAQGTFGFPIGLGIHIGTGLNNFIYQSCPTMNDPAKWMFISMMRVAIERHGCDWAIVTMDAFYTKFSASVDKDMRRLSPELLVKAGLAERKSCVTQIAQTKEGLFHVLSADEIGEKRLGPTVETDETNDRHSTAKMSGNLMLFQEPNSMIRGIMDGNRAMFEQGVELLTFASI